LALTWHIGVHKTATTHLQETLQLSTDALARAGIFYAGPAVLRSHRFPLIQALDRADEDTPLALAVRQAFARVTTAFSQQILSDENMLGGSSRMRLFDMRGRIYPNVERRLAHAVKVLGHAPDTVAFGVRDPASFIVSAFSLQVQRGHELDFRDFLRGRDIAALDWTDFASRVLRGSGARRLLVWRYEDYSRIRGELLAALLPGVDLDQIPRPAPNNLGLTQAGFDWMIAQVLDDDDCDLRHVARAAMDKFPKSAGFPGLDLVTKHEADRSRKAYEADLAALRQLPNVEFLSP